MAAIVNFLLILVGVYLLAGLAFAVPFLIAGAARLDSSARGAGWGFRLIIVPGVAALWPLLAWRWARGMRAVEHNPHRDRVATARAEVRP